MTTTSSPELAKDLLDPDGLAIIRELQARGYEAYFVGGSVRDLLLHRRPKDFDIATDARPEELKTIFGRRCRIIGRRFRLAHLYAGNSIFEVATFRGLPADQEVADDDSGFVVRANTFGTAREDARSRDFTVNGLFYDPIADLVIDHVGGLVDLGQHALRTIGDADARLREDPVRLLRAIKFAARLGFSLDPAIIEAAATAAPLINTCPAARVAEELYRLIESGHGQAALDWMARLGVLDALLPEIAPQLAADAPGRATVLAWLGEIDRLTRAHGTLPREATFALFSWPFIELALAHRRDAAALPWGRFALEIIHDLAIRLSIPLHHRHVLAAMADTLKRLRQTPPRRPTPSQLRGEGVGLALTVLRMGFRLSGQGQATYDLWAHELDRLGRWAAPAEPEREPRVGRDEPETPVDRGIRPLPRAAPSAVPPGEREGSGAPSNRRARRRRRKGAADSPGAE